MTVKTTDEYLLRLFVIAFTKRRPNQVKKTTYAASSQIRAIRKKMTEIIVREAGSGTLQALTSKLIPEVIGREIEKATQGIYPLQNVRGPYREDGTMGEVPERSPADSFFRSTSARSSCSRHPSSTSAPSLLCTASQTPTSRARRLSGTSRSVSLRRFKGLITERRRTKLIWNAECGTDKWCFQQYLSYGSMGLAFSLHWAWQISKWYR